MQTVQADDRDERGERRKEREEEQVRAPGRLLARNFVAQSAMRIAPSGFSERTRA